MSTATNVVVSRGLVVEVFKALNVPSASEWTKEKMADKLSQINALVPDGTTIGDARLDKALSAMIGAREMGEDIELLSDKAYEEKFPEGNPAYVPTEVEKEAAERDVAKKTKSETKTKGGKAKAATKKDDKTSASDGKDEKAENKEDGAKKKSTTPREKKALKIRGTESYHAGIALKDTNAVFGDIVKEKQKKIEERKDDEGKLIEVESEVEVEVQKGGKITDATWTRFYEIHGADGKNTRKGFMGAARAAIRAFHGHAAERTKPSKAHICGAMLKENNTATYEVLAAELDGSVSENAVIAKKAIQALHGYGALKLED